MTRREPKARESEINLAALLVIGSIFLLGKVVIKSL
jgi:hypothetical protein